MKEELLALEARKAEFARTVEQAPAPTPRLHPKLAGPCQQKLANLRASGSASCEWSGRATALKARSSRSTNRSQALKWPSPS
jgi:hypothetical protein